MAQLPYLTGAVAVFGTALAVAWLFRMVRVPSIIGFLVAGMVIGPSGLCLIPQQDVGQYSEFGLILLLFTIGLELSPEPLVRIGLRLFLATVAQIGLTASAVVLILSLLKVTALVPSLIIGIAVALSSTAIVLKQLSDRGETGSSMGTITTGILLLQDVIVIVVMLIISLAAGDGTTESWHAVLLRGAVGLVSLAVVVVAARRVLPLLLSQVVRHGGRELTVLFAVLMACGGAGLASLAGWSPGLGACIAGLLLAETDQRHQLMAETTPFRDVFNALFFVSLGMLVNLPDLVDVLPLVVVSVVATILLKPVFTAAAVRGAGWPIRIGVHVGIALCAVSEFSYVLTHEAYRVHLVTPDVLAFMLAYVVGTMMLGALVFPAAGPVAAWVAKLWKAGEVPAASPPGTGEHPLENHVIIIGYGFTGANLARMLSATQVPYCVVEMNAGLLKAAQGAGVVAVVGDATRMAILEHAGVDSARAVVVAINDAAATQTIVAQLSARRPEMYVLARTASIKDIDRLYQLGAKQVVPQDFETSIEVAAHVLKQFGVPDNVVEAQVASVRAGRYGMLRGRPTDHAMHAELIEILERTATQTFFLAPGSQACGRTVAEVNLRALTGCMIIAVVRAGRPTTNPPPDFVFRGNDVLVLVGAHKQVDEAKALLQRSQLPAPNGADSAHAKREAGDSQSAV